MYEQTVKSNKKAHDYNKINQAINNYSFTTLEIHVQSLQRLKIFTVSITSCTPVTGVRILRSKATFTYSIYSTTILLHVVASFAKF